MDQTKLKGIYRARIYRADGSIRLDKTFENIITDAGKEVLAAAMISADPSTKPFITHSALGSGTSTPAASDTSLETEVYRKYIASLSTDGNILYASAYYSGDEVTGDFKEAGIFLDAAGGGGVLLSRVSIDISKAAGESLTLDYMLTLT